MTSKSYVVFELGHSCYGIDAVAVQAIFAIPLIMPLAEFSTDLLGVIHWYGEILPILNLHQRLGLSLPPFALSDSIIVVQWQDQSIGILANQVRDVWSVEVEKISNHLFKEPGDDSLEARLVDGIIESEETLLSLLSSERIVHEIDRIRGTLNCADCEQVNLAHLPFNIDQSRIAHLDQKAQVLLRERTENLRQTTEIQEAIERVPMAVMGLEGERFGFGLEAVHEFTDIHKVTPIPCCPSHIVGNINLRGEIITLIDISSLIHLKTSEKKLRKKAIVVRLNDITAGIVADEIFDVVYVEPTKVLATPVAAHSSKDEYLQGVAFYQDKTMSIIHLSKILTSEALVVNEFVSVT